MLVRLYRKNPLNPLRVAFLLIRHNVGNISKDLIFKVLYNLHRIILSAYFVVEEIRYGSVNEMIEMAHKFREYEMKNLPFYGIDPVKSLFS